MPNFPASAATKWTGSSAVSWLPPREVFCKTQVWVTNPSLPLPAQLLQSSWELADNQDEEAESLNAAHQEGRTMPSILVGSEVAMTILMTWVYLET